MSIVAYHIWDQNDINEITRNHICFTLLITFSFSYDRHEISKYSADSHFCLIDTTSINQSYEYHASIVQIWPFATAEITKKSLIFASSSFVRTVSYSLYVTYMYKTYLAAVSAMFDF